MITQLDDTIRSALLAYRPGEPDALADGLAYVMEGTRLASLIVHTLEDAQLCRDASERSSIHNNGFGKLVLRTSQSYQLRLHIWDCTSPDSETQGARESIHSHTADFAAHILVGGYRHEIFREGTSGTEYFDYAYTAVRGARTFSLSADGSKILQRASDGRLPAGTHYTLAGDILHRVTPEPNVLTSSVVLQGPTIYDDVRVLSESDLEAGRTVPVRPLPTGFLSRYLKAVLDSIG